MIKRFHALGVGQIELENIGLQGTPANDRRYSNERLSEVFFTARDECALPLRPANSRTIGLTAHTASTEE